MKIAIIGYSGSGKSTLATFLGELYGLPVLHLDSIQFLPGWEERPKEERQALLTAFLDENSERGWVIDGTYSSLLPERRFGEADRILFLDFSRLTCLYRVWRRYRTHRGGKVRASAAEGCPEKLDREFFLWVVRDGRTKERRRRYFEILGRCPGETRILKSQRAINAYRKECEREVQKA